MHKPLEGIRVLELGIFHAGPGGTAILAEMGAEVIKIEQPGMGDPVRQAEAYKDINFKLPGDTNLFCEGANRGKKSITLDLKHPEGQQAAHKLVKKSDVFFTNLRRSTVKSMEMDYATLSSINPKLVYASVTSYGTRGPDADGGGFDFQGQARGGLMHASSTPDEPPRFLQWGLIDQSTAIMASYEIVIALLMRERLGIGQEVDVSLLGTTSYIMYFNNLVALLFGREVPSHRQATADPLRNYYRCKDGKWICQTQIPGKEHTWPDTCEVLGRPELGADARYNTRAKRLEHSEELVPVFNQAFATRTRDEWLRRFREKGLVICAVNTTTDAINDPQLLANEYIKDYQHPSLGRIRIPGFPIHFSKAEIAESLVAPKLGEHTASVLKEIGGYNDKDIDRLRQGKVI